MSAFPIFSSAALRRPFIFSPPPSPRATVNKKTAGILSDLGSISKLAAVVPASRLEVRPEPEMVSSGIPQLDMLTGGFARGCITEICGAASSGRTSILLFALAHATQRGEVCALVDASDTFDPLSAATAGMEMNRLLWVRCGEKCSACKNDKDLVARRAGCAKSRRAKSGESENFSNWKSPETRRGESLLAQMLKVTDLLLQSNGFGMIALDLADIPVQSARRIPLASWFRFRRVIERTPTVLLVLEQRPIAGSCSSALMKVSGLGPQVLGKFPALGSGLSDNLPTHSLAQHSDLPHSRLLDQFEITVELLRSRLERQSQRKPVQSTASFQSRAAWAG